MSTKNQISDLVERYDLHQRIRHPQYETLHGPNEWYSHATVLKNYCGIPANQPLHFAIEHGFGSPFVFGDAPTPEKESPLPMLAITSHLRIPVREAETNKLCFAVGPMNAYARSKLDASGMQFFKKFIGRTLLVFPSHSSANATIEFDVEDLLRKIDSHRSSFDTVQFCIYWADLLKGSPWVHRLAEYGELVTAGHPWDPEFQNNLRTVLELADVVAANCSVSALGYAAHLGKPIWLIENKVSVELHSQMESHDSRNMDLSIETFHDLSKFAGWHKFPASLDPMQHPDYSSSSSEVRSPEQMRAICELAESLTKLGLRSHPKIKEQMRELLQTGSPLNPESQQTLRSLLEVSDRSRQELKLFAEKHRHVFRFDPFQAEAQVTQPIPSSAPVYRDIKVDLCCGERKPDGFVGVDCYAGGKVDIVHDLNQGFPFEDSVATYVRGYDAIEHLRDPLKTMNEIWRICQNGAVVELMVPSTDGRGAFQDPTHVSFWNENSFMYYSVDFPDYLAHAKIYGFKGAFRILEMRSQDCGLKVIQIFIKLQAIKPAP